MCGFAGFLGYGPLRGEESRAVAERMGQAIAHRGPDDSGFWADDAAQAVLIHRRLSILDLSPAGHQPMVSASGRYVIAFNGEIYNHLSIRGDLDAVPGAVAWRGHSDTETLLAGIEAWGLERALQRSTGMFALAVWDRHDRVLHLARDRLGEKPLYYGWQRGAFLFASELKALKPHPAFVGEIDRNAIALQMRHSYIPAPLSIYKGISKLPAGCTLAIRPGETTAAIPRPYWSLAETVGAGSPPMFAGSDREAVDALDRLLGDAVGQQMVADVPLGAFLSGGVDSSTIVALMQARSTRAVRTFTIGFDEADYNEAQHAKAVARHLGTEHTELYVTARQAMEVIPRLPALYDEPFSDSSQIPTFLVSQMTRQHVTVALSGDGGDELFAGYPRYTLAARIWRWLQRVPPNVRTRTARAIRALSVDGWNRLSAPARPLLPARMRNVGDKAHKLAHELGHADRGRFYRGLVSHWPDVESVVLGARVSDGYFPSDVYSEEAGMDFVHAMMAIDTATYLPDDILCKVDRAAMGVSLETRVPLLDHRVVEFAWRLPLNMKIRNGQSKWILRQVLDRHVPRDLIERPKMGFGVPISSWLRGPLREWAEGLLSEPRLRREGYFDPAGIRRKWEEHLSGQRNWQYLLWDVLMFQAWLEREQA